MFVTDCLHLFVVRLYLNIFLSRAAAGLGDHLGISSPGREPFDSEDDLLPKIELFLQMLFTEV